MKAFSSLIMSILEKSNFYLSAVLRLAWIHIEINLINHNNNKSQTMFTCFNLNIKCLSLIQKHYNKSTMNYWKIFSIQQTIKCVPWFLNSLFRETICKKWKRVWWSQVQRDYFERWIYNFNMFDLSWEYLIYFADQSKLYFAAIVMAS